MAEGDLSVFRANTREGEGRSDGAASGAIGPVPGGGQRDGLDEVRPEGSGQWWVDSDQWTEGRGELRGGGGRLALFGAMVRE